MIEHRLSNQLAGKARGWQWAMHAFSFAAYHDEMAPNAGFPHPHADMEIITYVRAGCRRTCIVSATKAEPKPEMRKAKSLLAAFSGTIDWVAPYEDHAGLRPISTETSRE